jgi:hypothetical protein
MTQGLNGQLAQTAPRTRADQEPGLFGMQQPARAATAYRTPPAGVLWVIAAMGWLVVAIWTVARHRSPAGVVIPRGGQERADQERGLALERCSFHGISYDVERETCPACAQEASRRGSR